MTARAVRGVMTPVRPLLVAALVALSAASPADRLKEDRPVTMTAKGGIDVDLERRVGVAKGDVVIRRDDVTVCCDEAEAVYAEDRIERVTCRGRVVIVRPDGTRAAADLAVFEADRDAVTLSGSARVYAKDATLTGPRIVYDIGRDRLTVEGGRSAFAFDPRGRRRPEGLRPCPPKP